MSESSFFAHINKKKEPEQSKAVESSSDRFFAHIDQISAESQQATTNYNATRELDPDTEAQNYNMSQESGLPLSVVRNAPEQVKEVLGSPVYTIDDPTLIQKYLGRSYNNAAISGDDIPGLENVQSTWDKTKQAFEEGDIDSKINILVMRRELLGFDPEAVDKQIEELSVRKQALEPVEGEGFVERVLTSTARQLPQMLASAEMGIKRGVEGAVIGATIGELGGPASPVTVPGGFFGGAGLGFKYGQVEGIFTQEFGGAYQEFSEITDEKGVKLDPTIAKVMAFGAASVNAVFEFASFKAFVKTFPGGDVLLSKMTPDFIRKAAISKTLQAKFKDIALRAGKSWTVEITTEVLQETVTALMGEMAKSLQETLTGVEFKDFDMDVFLERLKGIASETAYSALGFILPGTAVSTAKAVLDSTASKKFHDDNNNMKAVVDESKTQELSPDHSENFMETLGMGQPVYISPEGIEELYLQSSKEEADTILTKIGVNPADAQATAAAGQDIEFTQSKGLAQLTPEEFGKIANDVKPSPGSYTKRDLDQQKDQEDVENTVALIVEKDKQAKAVNTEIDRITEEIKKTKLPDTKLAEDAPALLKGLSNRLALEGIDPVEFLQKVSVKKERFAAVKDLISRGQQFLQRGRPSEDRNVFAYQNSIPEKIIHEGWERGNSPRFDLEGAGDILREYTKKNPDGDYINEKLRRIESTLKRLEAGRLHPDDNISKARLQKDRQLERLKEAYEGQPTESKPQEAARQLLLSYIDGRYDLVRRWHDVLKSKTWDKLGLPLNKGVTFFQAEKAGPAKGKPVAPRGAVTISDEQTLISLFEGADLSTVLHEVGHIALLEYSDLERTGEASTLLKKDMSIIRTWVGATEGADLTREQSEQFARGFEAYLMEGKAPTTELRAAFERFKQWLIQTYKTAKSLNVKLDKNIRGVFDRMLSANLEVEATAASGGFTIKTTDEMNTLGVSKEDQLFATRLIEETTRKAERQLTQARNKNYSENLKKWKKEAIREIKNENPIYRTIDTIIEDGFQLDRDDFINAGQAELSDLPTRKLIKKDGKNIDMVAALYFDADAQTMIDNFVKTPKLSEAVAQRVNEKQLAHDAQWSAEDFIVDQKEYRDYLNLMARYINGQVVDEAAVDKAVNTNLPRWQKEAQKEITNESPDLTGNALDEAIATRVEEKVTAFRERKAKPSAITTDTLKRLARETMAAKPVREARRVDKFLAAAKKASSDGRRAILRKDWGAASTASELERFNYEMATLSVKIRDEVGTVQKRAKRIGQSKTIDFEHKEAILHLVGRYNLASLVPQEPQTIPDYASLFADDSFGNKGYPIPDFLLSNVVNDFRDLRIEQLRDLDNAIRYLEGQGRIGKKEIMADGVTLFADVNEDSVSILDTMKVLKKWEKGSMMRRLTDFTRRVFARLDSLTFVMKSADGYTNLGKDGVKGPLELYVIDPIKRGLNTLFAQKGEINKELKPHLKQIEKTNRKWRKAFGSHIRIEGVPVPEVMRADGQTRGWRDYQIWAVILNTGNIGEKSNMENLLAGYPDLTPAMVEKMKSMLSAEDMRAVQGVWDTMDSMFSQADAQFLKDNNYHMPKVIATPFRFKGQDFKGGYYPIKHDRSLSYRVADRGLVEDFFNNEGTKITVPYTKKNFSVKREGGVALPIRLELSLIDSHFRDVLNYIHLTDPIRDADRITRDDSFRESATNVLGEAVYNTIRPSLQHIANPIMEGIDLPAARGVELMRGLSTLYSLAWNTGVALKQPLSTFGAIRDMGFVPYVKGFSSVMVSPSMHYQRMTELSVYMKDRLTSFDRELKSQFLKLTAEQKGIYFGDTKVTWQDVKNFGFWQIRVADTVTVLPIWNGAFNDKLLPDQSNLEESIAYADDIVRNSQPSAQPLDLSSWQRDGGVLRLFSQFQTFTVGKYGQRQRLFYRAMQNGSISKVEYAWFNFMDAIVPLVGINLLQSILWGRDIDDEELSDIMANVLTGWATMGVPIVGSIARTVTTGYGDAFDSPVLETANKLIRGLITGAKSLDGFKNDKEREKALWALAHVISIYSGVPLDKIVARAQRGAKQKEGVPGIKYLVPAPKKK